MILKTKHIYIYIYIYIYIAMFNVFVINYFIMHNSDIYKLYIEIYL